MIEYTYMISLYDRVIPLSSSKLSGCAPRSKRVECLEQIGVVIDPALNVCLQCNSEENESWYLFLDQKFFPPSVRSKCMYTSQEKSSSIWRLGRTFTTRVRNHTMVPLTFLLTLIFFPLEVNNVTRIYLFFFQSIWCLFCWLFVSYFESEIVHEKNELYRLSISDSRWRFVVTSSCLLREKKKRQRADHEIFLAIIRWWWCKHVIHFFSDLRDEICS